MDQVFNAIPLVDAAMQAAPAFACRGHHCADCRMLGLCLPTGLGEMDIRRLDRIIARRRCVPAGTALYCMNDPFSNLYAIRLGHFKTQQVSEDGAEQIIGFQMAGDLLGMDGIDTDRHQCYAIALEDSEVCEIPFNQLEALCVEIPALLRQFHRIMSQEIKREQLAMLSLGNMRAEQRFASFLLNLSARYRERGYSETAFQLRMSREDIGRYLGLTIETVSRLLARFRKNGWIDVHNRDVHLLDLPSLRAVVKGASLRR